MTQSPLTIERTVAKWLALDVRSLNITYAQLLRLSSDNEGLRFELSADGMLIVMPPASLSSSGQNALLTEQLARWTRHDGSGKSFDSSGGFTLPNGAIRSPDAAWVLLEKWLAVEAADVEAFPSISPDFAVELRSPSDRLAIIQAKMVEYMENGVRLGLAHRPTAAEGTHLPAGPAARNPGRPRCGLRRPVAARLRAGPERDLVAGRVWLHSI